ncbi:cysteine-rich CWC family protein [Paenibacillus sp. OV219]|uniref:cysteine-rich CWC family protein n=1 Tax=Paenibacillus sp. OV219 TaxID=1884377 RepID=UPI0008AD1824|nr:cysteine-rich CWC family protein [Paenibacillus sp. OV219]SEO13272.1 Cysteine-rich CWC [Paenibacillus sp. OV219]
MSEPQPIYVSASECPLCRQSNRCEGNESCWCSREKFPKELIALVPEELKGKACICEACLHAFTR